MPTMYDTLVNLLVSRFEVDQDEITPDVTFEDLEMDSLFLVELVLVLQGVVGTKISDEHLSPRDTLRRAAEVIEEQIASAAQAPS
jgi:acyl carrier protein